MEVLRAVASERLSLRAAQRVFGVARGTSPNGSKKAAALPPLSQTLLPAEASDVLELDELWSCAGSKHNARWVWVALGRQTRQVVAYFVGDRSTDAARALRERILPEDRCRATRSDFWLAYDEVFARRTACATKAQVRRATSSVGNEDQTPTSQTPSSFFYALGPCRG